MNTKEVYINGILLDLDEANNPIQLTYAINDLAELKDRQAYASNIFKVLLTENNLKACGFPNNPNLIQTKPYRKNPGKIVQGGIEILPTGVAYIKGTNDHIEIQILSGLVGFFDLLGDKNIRDLDLSLYDHTWNLPTVAASQNNVDGYIYPAIDYGSLSATDKRADVRQLRPATFRRTIIEAIVAEAGYVASGSYQAYSKYNESLVAFSNDKFSHGASYISILNGYKTAARNPGNFVLAVSALNQNVVLSDDVVSDSQNQWNGQIFTAGVNMRATFSYKYSINQMRTVPFGSTPENYVSIQLLIGGVWVDQAGNLTTTSNPQFVAQQFDNQQMTAVLDLTAGDQVRINVLQQPGPNRMYSYILAGSELTVVPVAEDVVYGSAVQLAATLPDISQKNFFKDFLQNFGLIAIPDPYKQELLLINMEDVYNNKPVADDITDLLFNSVDDNSYELSGYGINNFGKYKEDDAIPQGFGDGLMIFDNQTLEDNVTLFNSVFAASLNVYKLGGLTVSQIRKIEDPAISLDFKIKTQPRILLNVKANTAFVFYDGGGSLSVSEISVPLFTGLDYQTLFNENYPEILRMLYRPFVVTKQINLRESHIAKIDWRIPVYDKKSASYYYKNEIKYIQNDISTISLIKLP